MFWEFLRHSEKACYVTLPQKRFYFMGCESYEGILSYGKAKIMEFLLVHLKILKNFIAEDFFDRFL